MKVAVKSFPMVCHDVTASRPSPAGGLRPALTRSNQGGEPYTSCPSFATSTRNDEGPSSNFFRVLLLVVSIVPTVLLGPGPVLCCFTKFRAKTFVAVIRDSVVGVFPVELLHR